MAREYIQVSQTSASLDPNSITTSLNSFHKLTGDGPNGLISRLNPFHNDEAVTFEFIAICEGANEPVEFYYGADDGLEILKQRLVSIYPSSFDIEHVEVDIAEKFGQPAEPREMGDDTPLHGVKWYGSVDRRKDWMTTLSGFSQNREATQDTEDDESSHSGRSPLAPLIDQMTRSEHPMVYQVLFTRKPDWTKQARRRSGALLAGTDTLLQKILFLETPGSRTKPGAHGVVGHQRDTLNSTPSKPRGFSTSMRDRERDERSVTRLDQLREANPKRTFTANVRLLAFPRDEDDPETLDAELNNLRAIFDPLDGQYYEIEGQRIRGTRLLPRRDGKRAEAAYERFCNRSIEARSRVRRPRLMNRYDSRPDLILNADELANFTIVPSASDLTVEGDRGTHAEQRSRNPLPRPNHSMTEQLRRPGLDLGYLLDENRDPETEPIRLPADLLPFHVGRFAKTGAGKSVALINDALSLVEQTSGPVFMIDAKGGGLSRGVHASARQAVRL